MFTQPFWHTAWLQSGWTYSSSLSYTVVFCWYTPYSNAFECKLNWIIFYGQFVNFCNLYLHLRHHLAPFCHWRWPCSMADDFSQSLTPPVSPFAADGLCELIAARPPCFCCSETKEDPARALSTEGYAARGSLKRYGPRRLTGMTQNILQLVPERLLQRHTCERLRVGSVCVEKQPWTRT